MTDARKSSGVAVKFAHSSKVVGAGVELAILPVLARSSIIWCWSSDQPVDQ